MAAPKNNQYAKGNKGGRPTKFKPHFTEDLIKFFDIEPYKQVLSEESKESFKDGGVKRESKKYRLIPNKLPTLYKFAKSIGISYWTVNHWADKGSDPELDKAIEQQIVAGTTDSEDFKLSVAIKEFSHAYKEAKELQKEFLINIGLAGAAPAPFAIFTAKNVTDMRDKTETDITSKGMSIQFAPIFNKTNVNSTSETGESNPLE